MKRLVMKPLFTEEELGAVGRNQSQDSNCIECSLYKNCKSPKMQPTGEGRLKILIIAEAPGKTEDEQNKQLIGDAGKLLRSRLEEKGFDLDRDFWKTNAVICRPPNNRKPKKKELKLCQNHYFDFIEEKKPKFIWLLGAAAIESYYMTRFSDDDGTVLTPTRWRALCIPDAYSKAWVIPLFHPSYALRNDRDELIQSQFNRDLDFAISCLSDDTPPVFFKPHEQVEVLTNYSKTYKLLQSLIDSPPEYLCFDYETTGLKPHDEGHKIACVGLCFDEKKAYSFPLQHPKFTQEQQDTLVALWKQVLLTESKKIAQGMKFEDVWSRCICKAEPVNWHHCTMVCSHVLDNRSSFTGLKFQSFIRWGVERYDSKINKYLKAKKGEKFNKVFEAPLNELLLYCGIDALLTFWLFKEQKEEMTPRLKEAFDFFIDGLLALSDVQMNGICMDKDFYIRQDKLLEKKITDIFKKLLVSEEAELFKKETGREIKFTSDDDLRKLFFDIMKLPVIKETETKKPAVDAEVMSKLKSPIAKQLTALSKLEKIKGTYIGQFLREVNDDGKLHPFFDLHRVQTYRSGSSNPNFQNIPVRDEDAKKYTRSGIYPSPGNLILDFDYSALEVRIIACYTQDPVLISYINDPSTDMHRDQASRLFNLPTDRVSKDLRFYAKNGWVFPQFYGSYFVSCAKNLWQVFSDHELFTTDKDPILNHLVTAGVIDHSQDFDSFKDHLKKCEDVFWKQFNATRLWQESRWAFYEKHGYIDLLTGFRCSGYMSRNDIVNYPVQGAAFHCLLWSLIMINDELKARGFRTTIIGQIHDCILLDCVPEEKEEVKLICTEIATQRIREHWNWICIPLGIEFEETGINQSWYSKKEVRE